MIALGTFWSLLSIFHKHLQPSIFRIYGAHTPNKTCPQIKKQTNFIIRYDFYPSFPNPPITAKTLSQQMVPGKRFPMVKMNLCFCFFSHLPQAISKSRGLFFLNISSGCPSIFLPLCWFIPTSFLYWTMNRLSIGLPIVGLAPSTYAIQSEGSKAHIRSCHLTAYNHSFATNRSRDLTMTYKTLFTQSTAYF